MTLDDALTRQRLREAIAASYRCEGLTTEMWDLILNEAMADEKKRAAILSGELVITSTGLIDNSADILGLTPAQALDEDIPEL